MSCLEIEHSTFDHGHGLQASHGAAGQWRLSDAAAQARDAQEPTYLQQILPSRFLFLSLLLALAV